MSETKLFRVYNNGRGSASYVTDKVTRVFGIKDSYKDISREELVDVLNTVGGRYMFEKGILILTDREVRKEFGLDSISEFILTKDELEDMLNKNDKDMIIRFLTYCPDPMLDKIIDVAIEMQLSNYEYINLITKYSGRDLANAIKEKAETSVKEKEGRAPIAATTTKPAGVPVGRQALS